MLKSCPRSIVQYVSRQAPLDIDRKKESTKKDTEVKAEMKSYHYTHFGNKDGHSELMPRDIYENERSKVIHLNSFGCDRG